MYTLSAIDRAFRESVRRTPDGSFLRRLFADGSETTTTFAEAASRTAALASDLARRGFVEGDFLVSVVDDSYTILALTLACTHLGVALVPFPENTAPAQLRAQFERLAARACVASAAAAAGVRATGIPTLALDPDAPVADDARLRFEPDLPYADAMAYLEEVGSRHDERAIYMVQPTSGTTGEPKLVVRRHDAFSRIAWVLRTPEAQPPRRIVNTLSLTHGGGHYLIAAGITWGSEIGIPSAIDVHTPHAELRRLNPEFFSMVPRAIKALRARFEASGESRLLGPGPHYMMTGGSVSSIEDLQFMRDQGVEVGEVYGASEYSLVARAEWGNWRPGIVGPILPDVELRVAPDGELLARTPVPMAGYFGDPELTRRAYTDDGFYRTGDYCRIEGGLLMFASRKRDVVNLFDGSNVYPEHIEVRLLERPWVKQAIVLGEQRPWLAALLVIEGGELPPGPTPWATPDEVPGLYPIIADELAAVNAELDVNERVRRFAILREPLPPAHYHVVQLGKVRRDRASIAAHYAALLAQLYAADSPGVPGSGWEARASRRRPEKHLVAWRDARGAVRYATTIDVSDGGVSIAAPDGEVAVGQPIELEFFGPLAALGRRGYRVVRARAGSFAASLHDGASDGG